MIKGICFDLWETIAYSVKGKASQEMRKKLKLKGEGSYQFTKLYEKSMMLKPYNSSKAKISRFLTSEARKGSYDDLKLDFRNLCRNLGIKPKNKLILDLEQTFKKVNKKSYLELFPEVISVLENLKKKGLKLALISNTTSYSFEKLNQKFNLKNYFDAVSLSFEIGSLKPQPKIFQWVISKLNLKPSEILMVGDNLKDDIKAAQKVGMKAVLVDRKRNYPSQKSIKNLKEIFKLLKEEKCTRQQLD